MARKIRKIGTQGFDLDGHLSALEALPKYEPNKLVFVPSFFYLGRRKLDEDYDEDKLSYRLPSDFIQIRYADDLPMDAYPFVSRPIYAFKCRPHVDARLLELIRLVRENGEAFFDELNFTHNGDMFAPRIEAARLVKAIEPDLCLEVRLDMDEAFETMETADLEATAGLLPTLEYSYGSAFRAFALPLIKTICMERPELSELVRLAPEDVARALKTGRPRDGSWQPELVDALTRPSAIAALYALRNTGRRDRAKLFGQILAGETALTLGDLLQEGIWLGSGEHDPVPSETSKTDFLSLLASGLAEGSPEIGEIRVSDSGNRFLEALSPHCDDADWLARILDARTGTVPGARYPEMAEWVKLQTRMFMSACSTWSRSEA